MRALDLSPVAVALTALLALSASPAVAAEETATNAPSVVAWETDCSTTSGWHWESDSPGMNTKVEQAEPSVIKLTQEGKDTWGKAAYVVENIDLEQTPILEIKVNKVDKGSAFTVAVANSDWTEQFTVIPRTSADGIHKGNIAKAVKQARKKDAWKAPARFNVVIIIEGKGKASWIDNMRIRSEN